MVNQTMRFESLKRALDSPPLKLPIKQSNETYRFHTMIKPSGSQCNLDCQYCFYLHKQSLLDQPTRPRLSDHMLELHIKQYIEAQTGDEVVFSWQGGEPTLMGLDFFRRVVELQTRYKKKHQRIENDLQTNGIALNEQWCAFLKDHNFLVGLSIDGPKEMHDVYRYSKGKHGSHDKVMRAIALLRKHEIPFSALCVVNSTNVEHPLAVYRFLRDHVNARTIQFIPCVEKTDFTTCAPNKGTEQRLVTKDSPQSKPTHPDSIVTSWSVDSAKWGLFLNTIWDEWFAKDFGKVFVDQFENLVSILLGYGSQKCVTSQICGKNLAIEHNGDLYSCDHFVYPEYQLGNIQDVHQGDLAFSQRQKDFAYAKHQTLPKYCRECPFLKLCWGHCPKDRFLLTPDGETGLQYLCSGLQAFYQHSTKDYPLLVSRLREN